MTDVHAEFNPFQPPVSATSVPRQTLGDDDEYLILKKQIHCREQVELPKICVFYGETEGVEPRRHTLRTMKGIAFIPAMLIGASALVTGLILGRNGPIEQSWLLGGITVMAYLAVLAGSAWLIWKKGFHELDVTWYLCARYRRRAAFERRVILVMVALIAVGLIVSIPWVDLPFKVLFIAVAGAMLACWKLSCEERLLLRNKRGDVFILTGHRKKFFEAATRAANHF